MPSRRADIPHIAILTPGQADLTDEARKSCSPGEPPDLRRIWAQSEPSTHRLAALQRSVTSGLSSVVVGMLAARDPRWVTELVNRLGQLACKAARQVCVTSAVMHCQLVSERFGARHAL